jgi:hypothetical protein
VNVPWTFGPQRSEKHGNVVNKTLVVLMLWLLNNPVLETCRDNDLRSSPMNFELIQQCIVVKAEGIRFDLVRSSRRPQIVIIKAG